MSFTKILYLIVLAGKKCEFMEALSFSSYFKSYKTYSVGTRDVADADAVLRKSFESSNVSKVSPSKIAPAQQRKWIDSSAVCIHHYFSNLLSTYLRLLETLGNLCIHSQQDNKLEMIMNTIPTG